MTTTNTTTEKFQIKQIVKFGMLFGYKIINTKDQNQDTGYEYSENELHKAQSRVELMNLLNNK
jgi:hypothetical protein